MCLRGKQRRVGHMQRAHVYPVRDDISTKEIEGPITGGMHEEALGFVE